MLRAAIMGAMLAALVPTAPSAVGAQGGCLPETEPNDAPEEAADVRGAFCADGTLPSGDQDLALWEVEAGDAATRWTIVLEGVPGTQTLLQVVPITSPPGVEPIAPGSPLVEIATAPESVEPIITEDLLLPVGRYIVGIARSRLLDGGEPETIDYRYGIEVGDPLPQNMDIEPNDDAASAQSVADVFAISGDRQGFASDFYTWTVSQPKQRWDVSVAAPLGENVSIELQSADGQPLDSASAATEARLYDLALDAGTYRIRVQETGSEPQPYVLQSSQGAADGDPEPNDATVDAVSISDGEPIRGRLAKAQDQDRFSLTVPPGEPILRDVRLIWRSDEARMLCLLDEVDVQVACREGPGGLTLPNLLLGPGAHTLQITGRADASEPYLLRVDATEAPVPDFETEPNDAVASATVIDPSRTMRARGGSGDTDHFRLRVDGEPQLWRVDVAGTGIGRLALARAEGPELQVGDVDDERLAASLKDLYLVQGDHWFSIRADGPEYTVRAEALGPPDPDAEREPNGDVGRAERYRIGTRRVGRLPGPSDRDLYRFTLGAPGHIRFDLLQPADAKTSLRLLRGLLREDEQVAELSGLPLGQRISYDLWLPAGDHLIELAPEQASEGTYELTSHRLDPFSLRVDQEPNDGPAWVRPIPSTLSWTGDAADPGDEDWYLIPPLTADGELRITAERGSARVSLSHAGDDIGSIGQIQLAPLDDGSFVAADAPLGEPLFLTVIAEGEYAISVEGAGLTPADDVPVPAVGLTWHLPIAEVAAYWPEEQVVDASLELTNDGSHELEIALETTTSHYLWQASLDPHPMTLPAGSNVKVPVTISAGADAWADERVLVSVAAVAPGGGQVSASVELLATSSAAPVGPRTGWTVPDQLLGGFNVASLDLGAVPGGTIDLELERRLFDGVTIDNPGFGATGPYGEGFFVQFRGHVYGLPVELMVDLAGDGILPIAGIILNPQAGNGQAGAVPRDFTLLLSSDGVTWVEALQDSLSPLAIDQAFVLEEPLDASHAMLRIDSVHTDRSGWLALGEWKVIAVPGTTLSSEPANIADPAYGGHVITVAPSSEEQLITLVDPITGGYLRYVGHGEDDEALTSLVLGKESGRTLLDVRAGQSVDLVVGFQDGRAAQVSGLEWQDPDGTVPVERLERAHVLASTLSPLGPWHSLGTWDLTRAADGSVPPLVLEDPAWVRYLRLSGDPENEARAVELPALLRVLERATDGAYRSIRGEWGDSSAAGPYEWLVTPEIVAWDTAGDAGDSQAEATELAASVVASDRVEKDVDEDWYAVDVPEGHSSLELVVDGRPTVGARVTLVDEAGAARPMAFDIAPDGSIRYEAAVEPGRRYALRVQQPPFSAVVAFDPSASIGAVRDFVQAGLLSFAADVRPGREAIMVVPFEAPPLLDDWEDDPYVIQGAVHSHPILTAGSSAAESGLIEASRLLAQREGARAILLITDAETQSFHRTPELWEALARVRPIIFSVHVGSLLRPVTSRHHMQDWAASAGGHYTYPATAGEMDRAFDRLATWMRGPADYTLSYTTSPVVLEPGMLTVSAPPSGQQPGATPADGHQLGIAPGVGVEIILDTSGSMLKKLGGKRRIDIARASLRRLIRESLAEGVPVAIRTFGASGSKKQVQCGTSLALPLAPLDRAAALRTVKRLRAKKQTGTPIAAALRAIPDDLADVEGLRSVVLITDGAATCGEDPVAAIAELTAAGVELKLDIIGFGLADEALKEQMTAWAAAGGGTYHDAAAADELAASIAAAVSAPIRVYLPTGELVAGGTVSGGAIELVPGTYTVEALVDPPMTFREVVVAAGEAIELVLQDQGVSS